jgi:nitroimidazol reductase NimA-like FMN-containing flavoprotein (pyridoxamine 5'-phosphate oxidase superfamily)
MPRIHLTRQDREVKDPAEIAEVIRQGRFSSVALCRDCEPYVVTLSYGHDATRNALYFHCAAKGLKLDFIRRNPQACATIIQDLGYVQTKCDHHYRSVVIWGEMRIVEDAAEKRFAVEVIQRHLEDDPGIVQRSMPVTDAALTGTTFLRLDIRELTGKKNT